MSLGPVEIIFAILGISILVIVHESGHYFAARAFGMRVERYSIGFGPTLFKYQPKGSPTIFQIAAIPFLAYVQIAGMNPHEEVDPEDPGLFTNKSAFARIVTIAAGPIANYLTASIFVFFISLAGWPAFPWLSNVFMPEDERSQTAPHEPMVAAEVVEDSAAEEAGIEAGDIFVEANGVAVANVQDLMAQTVDRGGQETDYVIERDGERMNFTLTPRSTEGGPGRIGVAAVQPEPKYVTFDVKEAAWAAVVFPWKLTEMQLGAIGGMIKNLNADNIGGPVAMTQMIGTAVQRGTTHYFIMLVLLSVALGMFNLLPLPALDGGRLSFLAYEVITRRRPNEKVEAMVHFIGILFLLGVLILVTVRDIGNWS